MSKQLEYTLPDGTKCAYPAGTSLRQIAADFQPRYTSPIVAAILNNQFLDLLHIPQSGGALRLIDLSDRDGIRVYSRSLSLVLFRAAYEVLPGCKVRIEHSLSKGIYGEIECPNNQPLTEKEVRLIAERMREIIDADEPIIKETVHLEKAIRFFEQEKRLDKVRLLKYKEKPELHIYRCGNYTDYLYGYMTPSTGYLKQFELKYYFPGFILRFPSVESPAAIPKFVEQRKLFRVFFEFEKWGRILEVADVGALNEQIVSGKGGDLIRIAEALHEKKIAQIADQISADRDRIRIILIAGPSSSGKTTFAQRLAVQLRVNGLRPISISIDDYFIDRDRTPLGPDGLPDFECLEAIDLELFNEQITALIQGLPVIMPRYDFQKGKREFRSEPMRITEDQPIIIEGIHGLNDRLTSEIPKDNKFKIYISALTQLNIDDHNRIPTTDNRIIRRIVRDHQFRGHDAIATIGWWPMVRRGEENYIFPFQEEADVMFNSALIYELAVLKTYAEPLLAGITPDYPEHTEAKRLLKFLSYFKPLADDEVPLNSILREFVGSSCFR
ncbi:MAG: nucleoside kinase [Firmicutes bacterium]|nr:nucleoside kinase [Bacillota bacterium]